MARTKRNPRQTQGGSAPEPKRLRLADGGDLELRAEGAAWTLSVDREAFVKYVLCGEPLADDVGNFELPAPVSSDRVAKALMLAVYARAAEERSDRDSSVGSNLSWEDRIEIVKLGHALDVSRDALLVRHLGAVAFPRSRPLPSDTTGFRRFAETVCGLPPSDWRAHVMNQLYDPLREHADRLIAELTRNEGVELQLASLLRVISALEQL